jgi:hypothetical protein
MSTDIKPVNPVAKNISIDIARNLVNAGQSPDEKTVSLAQKQPSDAASASAAVIVAAYSYLLRWKLELNADGPHPVQPTDKLAESLKKDSVNELLLKGNYASMAIGKMSDGQYPATKLNPTVRDIGDELVVLKANHFKVTIGVLDLKLEKQKTKTVSPSQKPPTVANPSMQR